MSLLSKSNSKITKFDRSRPARIHPFQRAASSVAIAAVLSACMNAPAERVSPAPKAGTRPVEHALGVANVPKTAERVAVLGPSALDATLALGVKPIASSAEGEFPDYLGDLLDGITAIGTPGQPNLEKILKLQPDLILGTKVSDETIYSHLSRIAPTVLTEDTGRDGKWVENFRLYAEALGQGDRGDRLLEDYRQKVKAVQKQIGEPGEIVVSVVFSSQGYIGFYSDTSFSGSVLADLELSRPTIQTQPETAPYLSIVSKEAFSDLDGDAIFLIVGLESEQLSLEEFINDPLFSQLSAVKKGRVYPVRWEVWQAGRSLLAAHQILQDVAGALTEQE
ncbi:MAG: iron-siderophore ABC transporter substrate-binding protein [Cyanobacteria bacterium P01_E01_bin.42]